MGLPAHVTHWPTLRVHHYWTSRNDSKGMVVPRQHSKEEGRAVVLQVRKIHPWVTGIGLPLTVGDGCGSVPPAGIHRLPLFLSAYPSVQMGFSVILSLSENEIQLQGKNC